MSEADVKKEEQLESSNPAMEKAMSQGWRPKEEWDGPEDQWVDYGEFNYRGELMGRISEQSNIIHGQKSKIGELETAIHDLRGMMDKIAENEYNKLLKSLKRAKAEAIEQGETAQVMEIDDQIEELKEQRTASKAAEKEEAKKPAAEQHEGLHPDVQAWMAQPENQWFNTDTVMRGAATEIARQIGTANPDKAPGEVLREMTVQMRKEFPHKFRKGSSVDSGDQNNRPGNRKGRSFSDLEPFEQEAARRLEKLGVMSVDDYIKQLDAMGE